MPPLTFNRFFDKRDTKDLAGDEKLMRLALENAAKARSDGDCPVGAVLSWPGGVASDRDAVGTESDPTAHAAINVIRKVAGMHRHRRLSEGVLYVSREPCLMCAAAAAQAGIREIVFGVRDPEHGFITSGKYDEAVKSLGLSVKGGVLQEQCLEAGVPGRGA